MYVLYFIYWLYPSTSQYDNDIFLLLHKSRQSWGLSVNKNMHMISFKFTWDITSLAFISKAIPLNTSFVARMTSNGFLVAFTNQSFLLLCSPIKSFLCAINSWLLNYPCIVVHLLHIAFIFIMFSCVISSKKMQEDIWILSSLNTVHQSYLYTL